MFHLQVRIVSHDNSTPLEELLVKYNATTNPVTKSVYRDIIASRLGITARHEATRSYELNNHVRYMRKLTYSFESRNKMEKYFGDV